MMKDPKEILIPLLIAAPFGVFVILLSQSKLFEPVIDAFWPAPPGRAELTTIAGTPERAEEYWVQGDRYVASGYALDFELDGVALSYSDDSPAYRALRTTVLRGQPLQVLALPPKGSVKLGEIYEIRMGGRVVVSYETMIAHKRFAERRWRERTGTHIIFGATILGFMLALGVGLLVRRHRLARDRAPPQ